MAVRAQRRRPGTGRTGRRPAKGLFWLVIVALLAETAAAGHWRPLPDPAAQAGTKQIGKSEIVLHLAGGHLADGHPADAAQHVSVSPDDPNICHSGPSPAPAEHPQPTGPHCLGCPNFLPQVLPTFTAAAALPAGFYVEADHVFADDAIALRPPRTPNHPRAPPLFLSA